MGSIKRIIKTFERGSIKERWIKHILVFTIIALLSVLVILLVSTKMRYDNAAELAIRARVSKSINTFFDYYNDGKDDTFSKGAAEYVESFQYKDKMEVWVLDRNGDFIVSSSGFSVTTDVEYEDYNAALYSSDNTAVRKLLNSSGEPITAMTYILRDKSGENYGAVRFLVSMKDMYAQLGILMILLILLFLLIIFMLFASGMYFVSAIVDPVQVINKTTGEIAKGNFDARVSNNNYADEIGELCDSINNMAKQLSEIDKMKNEFISTVSHEIRTPLTAIRGWGETLKTTAKCDELTEKGLDIILEETTRLSSMVEELLDFSRIQSNSMQLIISKVDLNRILGQIYLIYKQKAENENKTLIFHEENSDVILCVDADRIRQVFINILDNAIKYTPTGGEIKIYVERNEKCVRIYFKDNGSGIEDKDLIHVKEKFYKANTTVKGTGIGLAISDEIVKKHGGEININSEFSKGTLVEVLLPIREKGDINEQ